MQFGPLRGARLQGDKLQQASRTRRLHVTPLNGRHQLGEVGQQRSQWRSQQQQAHAAAAPSQALSPLQQPLPPRYSSRPVGHVLRVGEHTIPSAAAGAIMHQLDRHPKVLVLAVGANAVYAAVQAVAAARLMARSGSGDDIAMQPSLQPNPKSSREVHLMRLYLYRVPLRDDGSTAAGEGEVMRVGHATDPNRLAGAVCTVMQAGGSCRATAAGAVCTYRAIRGIAVARYILLRKHRPSRPALPGEPEQQRPEQRRKWEWQPRRRGTGQEEQQAAAKPQAPRDPLEQRQRQSAFDRSRAAPPMDLVAWPKWEVFEDEARGGEGRMLGISMHPCSVGWLEGEAGLQDGAAARDGLVISGAAAASTRGEFMATQPRVGASKAARGELQAARPRGGSKSTRADDDDVLVAPRR